MRIVHVVAASPACRALTGPHLLGLRRVAGAEADHVVIGVDDRGADRFEVQAFASAARERFTWVRSRELIARIAALEPDIVQCWGCVFETPLADALANRVVFDIAGDGDSLVAPCCDSRGAWASPHAGVVIVEWGDRLRDSASTAMLTTRVIRSIMAGTSNASARRGVARRSLNLSDQHCGVLILPPAHARSAGFTAVWAALLVAQIHKNVRIVIPAMGTHSDRLRELIRSTKFDHLLTVVADFADWNDLFIASDIGIQMHTPLTGSNGLSEMVSAGRRVVALGEPAARGTCGNSAAAFFAEEQSPKAGAAALLRAVDEWSASREIAVPPLDCTTLEYA
ncbi:MAG: hypothetical protein JNG88_13500, partial [Phycisphaerales bacterium]|nr:hypothetical protein [Phycisphaerales bacterium]